MIREHRSREKLEGYYRKFVEEGVLDPNVHPWVAESWLKSWELGIGTEKMDVSRKLPKDPWNNEYIYLVPGRAGELFEIISYGSDGEPGGEGEAADLSTSEL